jgi:hypothetical protein
MGTLTGTKLIKQVVFMNLNSRIQLIILVFMMGITVSCEKEVNLNLNIAEKKYLVVEGNLDDRLATQWIKLTTSSSYYDTTETPAVSYSVVKITDGEVDFYFRESSNDSLKGYYINNMFSANLKEGVYFLTIEHDGEVYTAQSEYRPVPVIDSVSIRLNIFSRLGITPDTLYDISIHFADLPGRDNYYLSNLFVNDKLRTVRPNEKTIINGEDLGAYVSYAIYTIDKKEIKEGDILTVEIRSISKGNYNFHNEFFYQTNLSGNPFAGASPANISTNLSPGALGYFQVSSSFLIDKKFSCDLF